ncbi:hypothetical protein ALT_2508 [Aspergillus lentulus]|uniref:Uncharacterized protein n=1 Tax=Aspergillus lentulus TaxID=293939 RepID=A0AAN4PEV4_ASPLE|nr:hypothetical protein ALT_2508 [Aspergillus lentulus]
MKASISLFVATLAASVFADLHNTVICVNMKADKDGCNEVVIYDKGAKDATINACHSYKNRNTDGNGGIGARIAQPVLHYCKTES